MLKRLAWGFAWIAVWYVLTLGVIRCSHWHK